jgi:hypothetical protein
MSNRPRGYYIGRHARYAISDENPAPLAPPAEGAGLTGVHDIPVQLWPSILPMFQQLGIERSNIPRFAPPAEPQNPTPQGWWHYPTPGIPLGHELAQQQQAPADLAQAGLALAQLGQPTQPAQQAPPQALLSSLTPQLAANTTTDPQFLRGLLGLLDSNSWSK